MSCNLPIVFEKYEKVKCFTCTINHGIVIEPY